MAKIVGRAKFVAGAKGSKKFSSNDLFGNLACKTYFFRFDCPDKLAELVAQNIPTSKLEDGGFSTSLTHHLKRILPADVFSIFEEKRAGLLRNQTAEVKSERFRLDDYFLLLFLVTSFQRID